MCRFSTILRASWHWTGSRLSDDNLISNGLFYNKIQVKLQLLRKVIIIYQWYSFSVLKLH